MLRTVTSLTTIPAPVVQEKVRVGRAYEIPPSRKRWPVMRFAPARTLPLPPLTFMFHSFGRTALFLLASCRTLVPCFAESAPSTSSRVFNVREFGATGDGVTPDTAALNRAVEACSVGGGGKVLLPPGRYLSGTVHLRSHVHFYLDAGARLIGSPDLSLYAHPARPDFLPPNAKWGKWYRGLIVGENLVNVTLGGPGIIDGNKVFDAGGEENMRGPHTIVFTGCRDFTIRDLTVVDSANYAVFFQCSDDVDIRGLKVTGGWDGVHWRGVPDRWCRDVSIRDCNFQTGDDCIAGSYWDRTVISGCTINSSCNGIRLIGPATGLIISDSLFHGPGRFPHRTSDRTNMLSGIILQPGAWGGTEGALDDVLVSGVTMHRVASPVTIWTNPGNTLGRVTVSRFDATGVDRSAISVENWTNKRQGRIVLRDVNVEYAGGGTAEQAETPLSKPSVDARPLPSWGFQARNVERVVLDDVRLSLESDDFRPVVGAEDVGLLEIDGLRYPAVEGAPAATSFVRVNKVRIQNAALPDHENP